MSKGYCEVGERLYEEIVKRFGTKKRAAEALGVQAGSYFNPYLSGDAQIGNMFKKRLMDAGFDLEFILSGTRSISETTVKGGGALCQARIQRLKERLDRVSAEAADISKSLQDLSDIND